MWRHDGGDGATEHTEPQFTKIKAPFGTCHKPVLQKPDQKSTDASPY